MQIAFSRTVAEPGIQVAVQMVATNLGESSKAHRRSALHVLAGLSQPMPGRIARCTGAMMMITWNFTNVKTGGKGV